MGQEIYADKGNQDEYNRRNDASVCASNHLTAKEAYYDSIFDSPSGQVQGSVYLLMIIIT